MDTLMNNPTFRGAFERLGAVTLDPARHSAANAREHSLAVATRARDLALLNHCSKSEASLLYELGLVHDIGKSGGSTHPAKSVEMLPGFGIVDPAFTELVKSHDLNLPWFISFEKGEAPSDKAWRKLASRTDLRLLALFMVADRVDCPGGWRANRALVWFLEEANRRGLIALANLQLDVLPPEGDVELSAGALLFRGNELLAMRCRASGYELPKGHVEAQESLRDAAARELREETGLVGPAQAGSHIGSVTYPLAGGTTKRVHYFRFTVSDQAEWAARPRAARELRWVTPETAATIDWVSPDLVAIVRDAFAAEH